MLVMRIVVERPEPIAGSVETDDAPPEAFTSWLELMRILAGLVAGATVRSAEHPAPRAPTSS